MKSLGNFPIRVFYPFMKQKPLYTLEDENRKQTLWDKFCT